MRLIDLHVHMPKEHRLALLAVVGIHLVGTALCVFAFTKGPTILGVAGIGIQLVAWNEFGEWSDFHPWQQFLDGIRAGRYEILAVMASLEARSEERRRQAQSEQEAPPRLRVAAFCAVMLAYVPTLACIGSERQTWIAMVGPVAGFACMFAIAIRLYSESARPESQDVSA